MALSGIKSNMLLQFIFFTDNQLIDYRDRLKNHAVECQQNSAQLALEARKCMDDIAIIDSELECRANNDRVNDRVAEIDKLRRKIELDRDRLRKELDNLYKIEASILNERKILMGGRPKCSGGCGAVNDDAIRPDTPYTCAMCSVNT